MRVKDLTSKLAAYPEWYNVRIYDQEYGQWLEPNEVVDLKDQGHPDCVGLGIRVD